MRYPENRDLGRSVTAVLALSLAIVVPVAAQSPVPDSTRVVPNESAVEFGTEVANTDEFLFVASRATTVIPSIARLNPQVYVFSRATGWSQVQKLAHSSAEAEDEFGAAMSVDNDVFLVGAPNNADVGAAYIYRLQSGSWIEEQRLSPSVLDDNSFGFGWHVGLHGDRAAVADGPRTFIFRYDGSAWVEEAVIENLSIRDLDADKLIGQPYFGPNAGEVHIYGFDGTAWSHEETLVTAGGPQIFNAWSFGGTATLHGELAIVGHRHDPLFGVRDAGAAYVFRFSEGNDGGGGGGGAKVKTFEVEQVLGVEVATADRQFGWDVAATPDAIVIGSGRADVPVASYLYRLGSDPDAPWELVSTFVPSTDQFGANVSLSSSGSTVAIARPEGELTSRVPSGEVWVYEYTATNAETEKVPDGLSLSANYPNPFSASTEIVFSLPKSGPVRINVYDMLGREIDVLLDEHRPAGRHRVTWEAAGLPGGTYFYRLRTAGESSTRMATIVR